MWGLPLSKLRFSFMEERRGGGWGTNNESPQSECFMLAKMCFQGAADKSSYLRQLVNFSRCLNWLPFCFKCSILADFSSCRLPAQALPVLHLIFFRFPVNQVVIIQFQMQLFNWTLALGVLVRPATQCPKLSGGRSVPYCTCYCQRNLIKAPTRKPQGPYVCMIT